MFGNYMHAQTKKKVPGREGGCPRDNLFSRVGGWGGGVPGLIIKILKIFCLIFIFSGGESGCPVKKGDFRIPPNDFVKEL